MATCNSNSWWDNYRETIKTTKCFRELVTLVGDREDVARNMIQKIKSRYPGEAELWYLKKLVDEQKEKGLFGIWSKA